MWRHYELDLYQWLYMQALEDHLELYLQMILQYKLHIICIIVMRTTIKAASNQQQKYGPFKWKVHPEPQMTNGPSWNTYCTTSNKRMICIRGRLSTSTLGASGRQGSPKRGRSMEKLSVICSNAQFLAQNQHIITKFSSHMSNYTQQKFCFEEVRGGRPVNRGGMPPPRTAPYLYTIKF